MDRSVDTNLIGVFLKEKVGLSGETRVRFYPSPEYLEAGKFKLLREILKEKGSQDYLRFYNSKVESVTRGETASVEGRPIVSLNFGAIAMVSGVKAEQAKQFLSELFALLIETNRKLTKEVKLSFKQFGNLHLYKNGELSFVSIQNTLDEEG